MEELYNYTIQYKGNTYRYDPDFDCFYRVYPRANPGKLEYWSPYIILCVLLAIILYFIS